jgi:hypothetical protein
MTWREVGRGPWDLCVRRRSTGRETAEGGAQGFQVPGGGGQVLAAYDVGGAGRTEEAQRLRGGPCVASGLPRCCAKY